MFEINLVCCLTIERKISWRTVFCPDSGLQRPTDFAHTNRNASLYVGKWWDLFGSNRDEATGEWRQLHNEELHDLYC
jgi:hypothetical protein